MKRNILVSGASGIVGYGILRSLQKSGFDLFLVGSSIYGDSVAPAFSDVFEQAPVTGGAEYLPWLLDVMKRRRIDLLFPGIEADLYHWNDHRREIGETGAVPVLNAPDLVSLCRDKWAFYKHIEGAGVKCAIPSALEGDFHKLKERFGAPFILKPRRGFGAKGIVRVDSEETFLKFKSDVGPVLFAQPIVGQDNEEYTTSVFCDGKGGYSAGMTLRRTLSKDGFTDKAEVVDTALFRPSIDELCRLLSPIGPTNFQFRLCQEGPRLLEINPRVSSSTSIRTAFGYNESAMAVNYYLNKKTPSQPPIRRGRAVRYTDESIFYEDGIYI